MSEETSDRLDDIIAEYIGAEESGEPMDRQELLAQHPDLADDLRQFFADRDKFQQLALPLGPVSSSNRPLPAKIRYFGDYELLEEIARGGMGVVYRARQTSLNRIVAVKMILAGHLASDEDLKRFRTEAEAAGNLKHPGIVAVHEVGIHQGQHYFSMDYVEGNSLAEMIRENPLPAKQAAGYVKAIAEAVQYAHQQGTLHRDLKPSNVLIDSDDNVHITDFGLAMRVEGDSELTRTGQILGTPSYMSPEQAEAKRGLVGPASDVYSLGVILYELIAGRPPFRAETAIETIRQVVEKEPASPRLLNPSVPRDLETICLKCLQKERLKRYQSSQDLADDLSRFLNREPIQARPISRPARAWRWCRRNPIVATLTTAVALALVIGTVVSTHFAIQSSRNANKLTTALEGQKAATVRVEGLTGRLIWKFDMNRKSSKWIVGGRGTRNNLLATPVLYDGRIYVASGQHPENGEGSGRLCCIEPTKTGDISSELAVDAEGEPLPHRREQAVNPEVGEKAIANPNSGLIWEFTERDQNGDGWIDFEEGFHRSMSSVAIDDGLLMAVDIAGLVHCFDAKTGKRHWVFDTWAAVYAGPLIVDGMVYVCDEDGEVAIFRLSGDPNVAMKKTGSQFEPAAEINVENSVYTTPIFANGTLYIADRTHLYAVQAAVPGEEAVTGHWPQWRGPDRTNVSKETGLLAEWPEGGPPLQWKVEGIGEGIASVSIADGRIYTVGYVEGGEYAIALDQRSGEKVWATRIGAAVQEHPLMRWLSQRSPTVDSGRVYVIRADGDLVCLQATDGVELWRKSYPNDFAAGRPIWGFCDYPLVDDDKLICAPGSPETGVAALNKYTGEVIWRTKIPGGSVG